MVRYWGTVEGGYVVISAFGKMKPIEEVKK